MIRLLLHGVVKVTLVGLLLRDTLVYPLLNFGGWIETLHNWAWTKLQNMEDDESGD